jgi:hypothetical protein
MNKKKVPFDYKKAVAWGADETIYKQDKEKEK